MNGGGATWNTAFRPETNPRACSAAKLVGSLVATVERILVETSVDPTLLEIEITESTLLADDHAVISDLESLRRLGTRISEESHLRPKPMSALCSRR